MAIKDRVSLGLALPHRDADRVEMATVRDVALGAERLGFRDLWVTENTLDHWAGYTVNPDDRERLRPLISQLRGKAPLLKEVGSFAGRSQEVPIFDLGGNVAEWVTTAAGGRALGGSADRGSEESNRPPAPEYIGFRVVRE